MYVKSLRREYNLKRDNTTINVRENNFSIGFINAFLLSIPLWISVFGWIKLLKEIF